MKRLLTTLLFSLATIFVIAQKGVVTGKIIDNESGEPVLFANVLVVGTSTGTTSDFDGVYRFELEPGTYDFTVSFIGYQTKTVTGVVVKADDVKTLDIMMGSSMQQLEVFVVEAKAVERSETALLKMQQKSVNVVDGISSQEIKNLGISNSAESMKQVTGASVEDGKYVVVRGLGDRYSISQMNGVTLPSPDPYRNSTSLDLIPANMIDNVISLKTFTPDKPGNFTGGLIDIQTKSLPDDYYMTISTGLNYNTASSFNDQFLRDPDVSGLDFLGYDDGTRQMPEFLESERNRLLMERRYWVFAASNNEGTETESELWQQAADELSNNFVPEQTTSFLDHSLSFAVGDQKDVGERDKFGYNFALRYSRSYEFKEDYTLAQNEFVSPDEALRQNQFVKGNQSTMNPELGALFSGAYQIGKQNQIGFVLLYNQSTDFNASSQTGQLQEVISAQHVYTSRNISMRQRQLLTTQLNGEHVLRGLNDTEINWVVGRTSGVQNEPDMRLFEDFVDQSTGDYILNNSEIAYPFHFFRELVDVQYNAQLDFETPIGEEKKIRIKYGGLAQLKSREFVENRFQLSDAADNERSGANPNYLPFDSAAGDYSLYFGEDNFGLMGTDPVTGRNYLGHSYFSTNVPANQYTGTENIYAGYLMGIFELTPTWKVIAGTRLEVTDMQITGGNDSIGEVNSVDPLPSLGVIKGLTENSNLRLNASRTLARPNMREMAPFESFDLISGPRFTGNPNLDRSIVYNFDIRYEIYPQPGELISVSGFYKYFDQPIMWEVRKVGSLFRSAPVNVESGYLFGGEVEFRKKLDFITESLRNYKVGANFTYIYSRVDKTQEDLEIEEALGADLKEWRPFQAQSPYLANLVLSYNNDSAKINVTVFANVFGPRMTAYGSAGLPDIYEVMSNGENNIPTPTLNLSVTKGFGDHFQARFTIGDILNTRYYSYQEQDGEFFPVQSYRDGIDIGLNLQYKF